MRAVSPTVPAAVAAAVLAGACSTPEARTVDVLLDGLFDEWREAASVIDDPPDAPAATVDILSVQALDDASWLYLALDVGNEVSLQALPGTLHLLLDTDGDRSTGRSQHDMDGVDLIVDLAQAPVRGLSETQRLGFGLRAVDDDGGFRTVPRHGLGVTSAPTWAAPRFELRLARQGADDVPSLGRRFRLKAVYTEAGTVLDDTEVGTYTFSSVAGGHRPTTDAEAVERRLARRPGTVRVAVWNVSRRSFSTRPEDFSRVLASVEPDVMLLDELSVDFTEERLAGFLSSGPVGALGPWKLVLGTSGVGQRSAIAARVPAISPAPELRDVPYPAGALEALRADSDAPWLDRAIDDPEGGISTTAAWLEIAGTSVLFVATDLQAAGWSGSTRDRLRILEAATIHDRVAAALSERPAPVVIGGDLNLVGSRAPLFQLTRGLDVDGSDLAPVDAERLGERTLSTWRNPGDVFAPGRLDFLLVPDGAVSVANSFVFATEDLHETTLTRLGLEADLMLELSDHLVLVADLVVGPPPATEAPAVGRGSGPDTR